MNIALDGVDFLVARAGEELASRIFATNRTFSNCADLLSFSNSLAQAVADVSNVQQVVRYENCGIHEKIATKENKEILAVREGINIFGVNADLVVSAYGLHWCDDIAATIGDIRRSMSADGLFLAALPGRGTLAELSDCLRCAELELSDGAAMRVDQFTDVQTAGSLLQNAGFALPVVDVEEVVVRYDNMFDLINDLKAMGAGLHYQNGEQRPAHRKLFKRAAEIYREKYSDRDKRIRATFTTVYLTGWVPHESQQQPAKPGSADISLADVLRS